MFFYCRLYDFLLELGYISTSACLVAAARTILEETSTLPAGYAFLFLTEFCIKLMCIFVCFFSGGVLTPGAAFGKSKHFIERLESRGITFKKVY